MSKPLHEMDLPEVLEVLTPKQKTSVLAYARQLARNTLSPSPSWFIDGRVQKPEDEVLSPAVFKEPVKPGGSVKCAKCGRLFPEANFKSHWEKSHPVPKKLMNPAKTAKHNKKKKHKGKKSQVSTNTDMKTPRIVQGGLCSPR